MEGTEGGQERFLEEGDSLAEKQELIRQKKGKLFRTKGTTACAKGISSKRIQNIWEILSTEVQDGERTIYIQEKRRDG